MNAASYVLGPPVIGVAFWDAANKAAMSVELFAYNVLLLKYLNSSTDGAKTKSSTGPILFEIIDTVAPSAGMNPDPCGPVITSYCDTSGLVVPDCSVTAEECNGETNEPSTHLYSLWMN